MPMPTPRKGEEKDSFISRCMSEMKSPDRTNEQNVAACMQAWRDVHGGQKPSKSAQVATVIARFKEKYSDPEKLALLARAAADAPEPEEGESKSEFMERCRDEVGEDSPGLQDDDVDAICED